MEPLLREDPAVLTYNGKGARTRPNNTRSTILCGPSLARARSPRRCYLPPPTAGCSLGFIGHTALHWAASKNYIPLIRWLISEGLPVNVPNNGGSLSLIHISEPTRPY